jgi:hypothetical protein
MMGKPMNTSNLKFMRSGPNHLDHTMGGTSILIRAGLLLAATSVVSQML